MRSRWRRWREYRRVRRWYRGHVRFRRWVQRCQAKRVVRSERIVYESLFGAPVLPTIKITPWPGARTVTIEPRRVPTPRAPSAHDESQT